MRKATTIQKKTRGVRLRVFECSLFIFSFFYRFIFCGGNVINHFFNDHFLDVYVETHQADEAETLQKFLIFFVCVLEGSAGEAVVLQKVLDQLVDLAVLHAKNFIVYVSHIFSWLTLKIFVRDGTEKFLDVRDGKNILKIVDKDQHEKMILGITLLLRGREQIVLGIVVDHGLGQDLVIVVALGGCKLILHESSDLVHVKINVRQIFWLYIIHSGNVVQNAF